MSRMYPSLSQMAVSDEDLYRVCVQLCALEAHQGELDGVGSLNLTLLVGPDGLRACGVGGGQLYHPGPALRLDAELPQVPHLQHLCRAPLAVEARARVALAQAEQVYGVNVSTDLIAATLELARTLDRPARLGLLSRRSQQARIAAALTQLREVAARTPLLTVREAPRPAPSVSEFVGTASWVD